MRNLSVLLVAACGLLTACPKPPPPKPQAPPVASAQGAGRQADPAAPPAAAPAQSETPAAPKPPAGTSSASPPPSGGDEHLTANEKAAQRELARIRPKVEAERNGPLVRLELTAAKLNPQPDARLSDLTFTFTNRDTDQVSTVTMTDKKREVSANITLPFAAVKVWPQVQDSPSAEPFAAGEKMYRFSWRGRYAVEVFDQSKSCAMFLINADGGFELSSTRDGYGTRVKRDPDTGETDLVTVKRKANGQLGADVASLRWNSSGFNTQAVSDSQRNRYEYKFPAGELELIPPQ